MFVTTYLVFKIWRFLFLIPQNPRDRTICPIHDYSVGDLLPGRVTAWSPSERDFCSDTNMILKKISLLLYRHSKTSRRDVVK